MPNAQGFASTAPRRKSWPTARSPTALRWTTARDLREPPRTPVAARRDTPLRALGAQRSHRATRPGRSVGPGADAGSGAPGVAAPYVRWHLDPPPVVRLSRTAEDRRGCLGSPIRFPSDEVAGPPRFPGSRVADVACSQTPVDSVGAATWTLQVLPSACSTASATTFNRSRGSITRPARSLSTLRSTRLPASTHDSLPAAWLGAPLRSRDACVLRPGPRAPTLVRPGHLPHASQTARTHEPAGHDAELAQARRAHVLPGHGDLERFRACGGCPRGIATATGTWIQHDGEDGPAATLELEPTKVSWAP